MKESGCVCNPTGERTYHQSSPVIVHLTLLRMAGFMIVIANCFCAICTCKNYVLQTLWVHFHACSHVSCVYLWHQAQYRMYQAPSSPYCIESLETRQLVRISCENHVLISIWGLHAWCFKFTGDVCKWILNMYASLPQSNAVSMANVFTHVTLEHNNLANSCSLLHGMWVNKSTKNCFSRHLMSVCSIWVTCVQCFINLWGSGQWYNCM